MRCRRSWPSASLGYRWLELEEVSAAGGADGCWCSRQGVLWGVGGVKADGVSPEIALLGGGAHIFKINLCSKLPSTSQSASNLKTPSSLLPSFEKLDLKYGYFSSDDLNESTTDYGNITHNLPWRILHQASVEDISILIQFIFGLATTRLSDMTVAASGNRHCTHGQAQALNGVVIEMQSLRGQKMQVNIGDQPYVDVSGGELWINVLNETLNHGLSPKSWTDYLYLTVGGTLSNAGLSGQAFKYGPQIENVYQLEVVTGKGDVVNCSAKENADLFYAVLGGLGQFGIITQARIALAPAPEKVKVVEAIYSNFSMFSKDQVDLISRNDTFDYIEGFAMVNITTKTTRYRLEVAKYFNPDQRNATDQKIKDLLSGLSYNQSTLTITEASYEEFLDRVHITAEIPLRKINSWNVPHPWLNLMIPRSKIQAFTDEVFGNIFDRATNGPVIIYPINTDKWNKNTSFVIPDESDIYLVSILAAAFPSPTQQDDLQRLLDQNRRILDFCERAQLTVKQYLGYQNNQADWQKHFGSSRWDVFKKRKSVYDPFGILAPGQGIFPRSSVPIS
ncbi:cytokinin dehydrogenase 1-like [Malania oleifera]|uniref:cytokinin dehydrogenase 1-like n=1 Tax=Malania oleifera TaxID=397392 RepID=UPI0025ADC4F9|nr:cytokinin dehydrogenase 1-like [Malania oleifera]